MKLTGIHVDGYGTLADLDLDGIAPSLTVVYGLNEAGKSTLLDFVRAVLFGFPDRRSRQNARPPLRGGRHGG
ncbi:MAG: ATP-binding protein, partial [Acidimicrobiales bacterium]